MHKLIAGVHRFREKEFGRYSKLFRRLASDGQRPHSLFITCADSRVLAELITQSKPGDLFVVKNVGNIVPPATLDPHPNSTAAAIEFAVEVLGVSDIVVCGHSQCGAMDALVDGADLTEMPHLKEWLDLAGPVRQVIAEKYSHLAAGARSTAAAEENVLFALENLKAYPRVADRLAAGTLQIHGWFFEIATAELFAYDPALNSFEQLVPPTESGTAPG